jgi:hypothetical protein
VALRNKRTLTLYWICSLYFYFSGVYLIKAADDERLLSSCFIKRNHVSICGTDRFKSSNQERHYQKEKED